MSSTRATAAARRFANRGEAEGFSDKMKGAIDDLRRLRQNPRTRGRSWRGDFRRKPMHPLLQKLKNNHKHDEHKTIAGNK